MGTSNPPNSQPAAAAAAPAMPTAEDLQAIVDRASEAAARAETSAQRLAAAETAAGAETRERWPDMPEELVAQISQTTAKATVDALTAQYELRAQPPTPDTAPAADAAPAEQPAPADAAASAGSEGPARKTWAQRLLGE